MTEEESELSTLYFSFTKECATINSLFSNKVLINAISKVNNDYYDLIKYCKTAEAKTHYIKQFMCVMHYIVGVANILQDGFCGEEYLHEKFAAFMRPKGEVFVERSKRGDSRHDKTTSLNSCSVDGVRFFHLKFFEVRT